MCPRKVELFVLFASTYRLLQNTKTNPSMWKLADLFWNIKVDWRAEELVSCERALPQRKGAFFSLDGCCRLPLSLAPPGLARGILIGLQDTWVIKARAHSTLTWVGGLILTAASSILSVMKGHLQGLMGKQQQHLCYIEEARIQNTESRLSGLGRLLKSFVKLSQ